MFRKAKGIVGLDIGSSAVKAVELKQSGKAFRVAHMADTTVAELKELLGWIDGLLENDLTPSLPSLPLPH